jgi:hypothetical protein
VFIVKQVRITEISGSTAYPISVYISDIYLNYQTLLGTINDAVPPVVEYNTTLPSIFQTAPQVVLTLIDNNNCQVFKILDCTFGCTFLITIELASCIVNIDIQEATCGFNITSSEVS